MESIINSNTKHVLMTPEDCTSCLIKDWSDGYNCPVCDWGLGVCKNCNASEIQLEQYETCEQMEFYSRLEQLDELDKLNLKIIRRKQNVC